MTEGRQRRVREFRTGLAALQARLGTDEAMQLLMRATEALGLLEIDRKEGVWLALRGAERLADRPSRLCGAGDLKLSPGNDPTRKPAPGAGDATAAAAVGGGLRRLTRRAVPAKTRAGGAPAP